MVRTNGRVLSPRNDGRHVTQYVPHCTQTAASLSHTSAIAKAVGERPACVAVVYQ